MDQTSDPQAMRFVLDSSRADLAREYKENIFGPYSKELTHLLTRMRWGPVEGRYVLVVLEQGKRWHLARMPAGRGTPVELFPEIEFMSIADAEWHVFKLRWEILAGTPLEMD